MVKNSLWQRVSLFVSVFSLFVLFAPQRAIAVAPDAVTNLTSSTHTAGTVSNVSNITFTWTVPTNTTIAGYSYVISTSSTESVDTALESNDSSFNSVQVTASSDSSTWYFRIRAIGTDGTPGSITTTSAYNIDTTAPSEASSVSATAGDASNEIAWTPPSTDYVGTTIRYSTTAYPTSYTDGTSAISRTTDTAGQAATYTHSNLTNGTLYYYSVYVYDQAGNYSTVVQATGTPDSAGWSSSVSIDAGASYSNSSTAAVSLTLSASTSTGTTDGMQFSIDESTWTSGTSGAADGTVLAYATSSNYTFSDTTDGTKTLYMRFVANCTNAITGTTTTLTSASCDDPSSSVSDTVILDTTVPTGSITVPSISNTAALSLTLSGSDTNSVSTMEIDQDSGFATNSTGSVAYNTSYTYTLTSLVDGDTYTIFVRYTDSAGNVSTATYSDTVVYDSTATTYAVGGTVTGLSGTLVLQNNGGDDETITANGTYTFATSLVDAASYSATILTYPSTQTCTLSGGSGTISTAAVTSVNVSCVSSYTVGGTLSGLSAGTVVLQNNSGDDLTLTADGFFFFSTSLLDGASYSATILTDPSTETCIVSSGSGTISSANVADISVACTMDIPTLSEWGLILLSLVLLSIATYYLRRRTVVVR